MTKLASRDDFVACGPLPGNQTDSDLNDSLDRAGCETGREQPLAIESGFFADILARRLLGQ